MDVHRDRTGRKSESGQCKRSVQVRRVPAEIERRGVNPRRSGNRFRSAADRDVIPKGSNLGSGGLEPPVSLPVGTRDVHIGAPKEAAALISPEVRLDPGEVEAILPKFNYNPVITPAHVTELKATEAFLRESGLSKGPVDIDKLFDASYLEQAGLH